MPPTRDVIPAPRTHATMRQWSAERRCAAEGCDARLSRYNPSRECAAHAGWANAPPALQRARRR